MTRPPFRDHGGHVRRLDTARYVPCPCGSGHWCQTPVEPPEPTARDQLSPAYACALAVIIGLLTGLIVAVIAWRLLT